MPRRLYAADEPCFGTGGDGKLRNTPRMPQAVSVGYSGTPLAKKLGITASSRMVLISEPADYQSLVAPLPPNVTFGRRVSASTDLVHCFVTTEAELQRRLAMCRKTLRPDATIWVSWPKRAAGIATSVTEDVIRAVALPLGFVDVKVCAVDATWSGLKLVVRKNLR